MSGYPTILALKILVLTWIVITPLVAADAGHPDIETAPSLAVSTAMRTIYIEAYDTMRYSLDAVTVTPGETVRFIVTNKGMLPHEFNVGTPHEQAAHAARMAQTFPEHGHGDAAIDLRPGETKEVLYTFAEPFAVQIACLYPGHLEAGMKLVIKVT